MKLLFIGNSATYVHKIPQTLAELASKNGILVEVGQVVKGGFELAQHADASRNTESAFWRSCKRAMTLFFCRITETASPPKKR